MPPASKRRKLSGPIDTKYYLRHVFRKESFRPLQEEIINAALEGEDIFVQAATSFGKSLCFQLPAIVSRGVTVVISPLLALVQNQVDSAKRLEIEANCITGNTPLDLRKQIETDLQCGHPKTQLLYVTPELCGTDNFRKILLCLHRQGQLVRIAIDEAHCISEWGHDFRPAYKELQWLKSSLQCPSVPIMALTATATAKVRKDVYKYLKLKEEKTLFFSTTSARPNIHYEVQYFNESSPVDSSGDDEFPYLLAWFTRVQKARATMIRGLRDQYLAAGASAPIVPVLTGIIYVCTRALTETLASKLQAEDINAHAYHAGMKSGERIEAQNRFIALSKLENVNAESELQPEDISQSFNIMVATSAFGMGIDVPSIRFVIHYGVPKNLEAFVQESGRAGRDNKAAFSLLFYTREERERANYRMKMDIAKEKSKVRMPIANARLTSSFNPTPGSTQPAELINGKLAKLQKMFEYCENSKICRHKVLSDYFGSVNEMQGAARSKSMQEVGVNCDYTCDICKEGASAVTTRHQRGLAEFATASQFVAARPGSPGEGLEFFSRAGINI